MNLYYVFQGLTHEFESSEGYLWSPQKNKVGGNNLGYTNMGNVKKGDIIFHGAGGKTYSISIAIKDSYVAIQPLQNKSASKETVWSDNGYRVDSNYTILETPLIMKEHSKWFSDNHDPDSAFTVKGNGKQIYLSKLSEEHAKYILKELLILPQNNKSVNLIKTILQEVLNKEQPEYDRSELEHINTIVEKEPIRTEAKWLGERKQKEYSNPLVTNRKTLKRNVKVAANALNIAKYLCENDIGHKLFLRKNSNINYTEPHHLIPLSKHEDFNYSLDVEENIVSLCSHCHNLLHYGRLVDKKEILDQLFTKRKEALKTVGLYLENYGDLEKYYN